jgi:hypothetical protein
VAKQLITNALEIVSFIYMPTNILKFIKKTLTYIMKNTNKLVNALMLILGFCLRSVMRPLVAVGMISTVCIAIGFVQQTQASVVYDHFYNATTPGSPWINRGGTDYTVWTQITIPSTITITGFDYNYDAGASSAVGKTARLHVTNNAPFGMAGSSDAFSPITVSGANLTSDLTSTPGFQTLHGSGFYQSLVSGTYWISINGGDSDFDPYGSASVPGQSLTQVTGGVGELRANEVASFRLIFDVISQEVYAGLTDYGVETIRSYTKAALSMPGYSNDGSARSVRIPVGTSSEPVVSGVSSESVTSIFAGYTHYSTGTDSSINGADYDIRSNGGIVGVRHEVSSLMLGGFLGVDEGEVNSSTLNSDSEALLLGAIASYTIKPEMNLVVTGGITYGSYEFSGTRTTASFDDVGSDVFDIHVGLEGDAYAANDFRVTPFVGFHYIYSDTEAFTETGLGGLSVHAHDYDAFFSEIGVKTEYQLTKQVSLNGNLSYTHNLSGSDKNIGASLGGTPFAVASPGLGNDFFTIGIGAQYQVTEDVRLGINYRAEFSTDADVANGVNVGGSYSF